MNKTFRFASLGIALAFCGAAFAQEGVQWTPPPSTKDRAEVRAELEAARRDGTQPRSEDSYTVKAASGGSAVTRAQVMAEAREAMRLGLIPFHDAGPRQATAAELEQIRQAGLRAVTPPSRYAGK